MIKTVRLFTPALLLTAVLSACGGGGSDAAAPPESAPTAASATLTANGSASQARVRYSVDNSTPIETTVTLPWSLTVPLLRGQTLSATATNAAPDGQVSLQINGSEGGTVSSSGSSTASVRFTCCG